MNRYSFARVTRNSVKFSILAAAVAAAGIGIVARPADAAIISSWNGNNTDVWSNNARWTAGIPTAAGDTATIDFNISGGNKTVTIDGAVASRTVGNMNIGDSNASAAYIVAASGGGTLTFNNSGANAVLTILAGSNGDTISAPIVLADTLEIKNGANVLTTGPKTFTISGLITTSASKGLVVDAGQGVTLSNNSNVFSGLNLKSGTLNFSNVGQLGGGTLTLSGGILNATSSLTLTSAIDWQGDFALGNSLNSYSNNNLNFGTFAQTLENGSRVLTINANRTYTFGGGIGEAQSGSRLNIYSGMFSNTSNLILGGTNTYTGGTYVNSSRVTFSNAGAIPTTGDIVIGPSGSVTVTGAHTTLAAWLADSHLSTASTGALALGGGSAENFDPSASGFTNLSLGAASNGTYTGTYTPYASGNYYVGGGGATITFSNANAFTGVTNIVAGNGGGGTVVITNTNDYSGSTTVQGGTLQIGTAGTISTGDLILGGGQSGPSTLQFLTGRASGHAFASTTLESGMDRIMVGTVTSGFVDLGGITRNVGSVLVFNGTGVNTNIVAGKISTSTPNEDYSGSGGSQTILGGWAIIASGTGTADWAVSGSGATPGLITALATYSATLTAGANVGYAGGGTVGSNLTINSLKFTGAAGNGPTVNAVLTIATGGILYQGIGAQNGTLFTGSGSVTSGNGKDLIISYQNSVTSAEDVAVPITGNIGLTVTSLGGGGGLQLRLSAANTFTGETNLNGSASNNPTYILLNNALALQNSTLNYDGKGGYIAFNAGISAFTFGGLKGSQNLELIGYGGSPIALSVGNNDGNSTYSGALTGSGSIKKIGSGTFTLSNENTYTGVTQVDEGTLQLTATGSVVSNVTVGGATATGTPTLAGSGTIKGTLLVSGTASGVAGHLAPGASIGTITAGDTTFNDGAILDYEFGTGTGSSSTSLADLLSVTGNLTLPSGGIITLNLIDNAGANGQGSLDAGVYKIMAYTGSLTNFVSGNGVTGSFVIGTTPLPGTTTYSFADTGSAIELTISLSYKSWTGQINGIDGNPDSSWNNGTSVNFAEGSGVSGATAVVFNNGDAVTFEDTNRVGAGSALTNYTVSADSVNPGFVTFNNVGTYDIGSTGTGIGGSAGILKKNTGRVILSGANTFTSVVTISGGAIRITDADALGNSAGVTVGSGAALEIVGVSPTNSIPLSLSGAGVTASPAGALNSISGANNYSGAITLAANATITTSAGSLDLTGGINTNGFVVTVNGAGNTNIGTSAVTGAGGIAYSGSGTLTLTGSHTYSGTTNISSGNVVLASGASLGNTAISAGGSGTLSPVAGTSVGDAGAGSAGATLAISSGGALRLDDGTIADFNVNQQASFGSGNTALTLSGGSLYFDLDSATTTFDTLAVNVGNASVSGSNTINLSVLGSNALTFGTYNLITVGSGGGLNSGFQFSNSLSTANITVGANSYGLTLIPNGTALQISIGNAIAIWDSGDVDDNNWTSGDNWVGNVAPSVNDVLAFGSGARTTPNNDFAANTQFSGIVFNNGSATFTLIGNVIDLNGDVTNSSANNQNINLDLHIVTNAVFNAGAGGLTVNGVISGTSGVEVVGAGVTTFTGNNTFSGGLTVSTGTLAVATVNNASTNGVFGNNTSITLGGSTGTLDYTAAADATTNMPINLPTGGTGVVQVDSAANVLELSGNITGAGELKKTGAGTLLLSGANSYGGGTDVNAGKLAFDNGSIGNGAIKFTGGTLIWNTGNTQDVSAAPTIAGSTSSMRLDSNGNDVSFGAAIDNTNTAGLTKLGVGTLNLTVANAYTGGTVLNGGTIQQSIDNALSTVGNISFTGGTLKYSANAQDLSSRIANSTSAISIDVNGNTVTYAGAIAGTNTGGLTVSDSAGTGRLILTSSSSLYTGTITINTGATLQWGSNTATNAYLPAGGSIVNDGTLDFRHGPAGTNYSYTGSISGSGKIVVNGNTGGSDQQIKVVLKGTSSYSGGTVFNSGLLAIQGQAASTIDTALGAVPGTPTVNLTFNGGALGTWNSDGLAGFNTIELHANRTILLNAAGGYFRNGWGIALKINGQITGAGGFNVVFDGGTNGVTYLQNSTANPNDYAGDTTIGSTNPDYYTGNAATAATLRIGAAGAQIPYGPGKGNVVFGVQGALVPTLDLNGFSTQINGLSAAAQPLARVTSATAATLTVGNNDQTSTFVGGIQGATSIYKVGTGTLTLGGGATLNTYTGSTTINAGTLALDVAGTFANSPTIVVGDTGSSGAVLDLTAKASFTFGIAQTVSGIGDVNIGAGKLITIDGILAPGNSVGTLTFDGDLTLTGSALMEITDDAIFGTYDVTAVSGLLTYGGTLDVSFLTTNPSSPGVYTLFNFGSQTGDFAAVNLPTAPAGLQWHDYGTGDFFDNVTGQISLEAVPEPASLGLLAIGSLGLMRRRRPRNR